MLDIFVQQYSDTITTYICLDSENCNGLAQFELKFFDIIDNRIPDNWVIENHEKGISFSPREFLDDFWDSYLEEDTDTVRAFERMMRKLHKFHGWKFKPEIFDDFIEQLLLQENQYLRPQHDKYIDVYLPVMADYVDIYTKIHALGSTIVDSIQDNTLLPQTLFDSLNVIEIHTVQLEDTDEQQFIGQNFFKPILSLLLSMQEDDSNYRYRRLFKDYLGPACEEACDRFNATWRQQI